MSCHRSVSTSPRRHPVSASSRTAATATGHWASRASSARPSRVSSPASRNRATWFLGFFAIPRQGLLSRAQAPFLGPEHHRAQNLEGAVGRARLVLARRVEPRGHVLRADAVERHLFEGGQDAGLEVDAHGLASRGLPVRFAAPEILDREFPEGRGLLLAPAVVGGVLARADAREHVAGAHSRTAQEGLGLSEAQAAPAGAATPAGGDQAGRDGEA